MNRKSQFAILLLLFIQYSGNAQLLSPFIHVDQFGYLTNAEKVAVISNPQIGYNSNEEYIAGPVLELIDATNNNSVFSDTPNLWNNGTIHDQSGDIGWWFDFSSYNVEGSYYILDPMNNQRSAVFDINSNPYYAVLQAATKMFYYNRCNATKEEPYAQSNWTDIDNFTQDIDVRSAFDQNNEATSRDLRGGWFDAGDYNKYVTFTHNTIHQLLTSYENNPAIFRDNWNIPESNNGVPDLLDELKWEFDWLYKMVNSDGTVILKMGSLDYDINDFAPPSNNFSPRYYTPTCSSASLTIASTHAHAAKIYATIPKLTDFANILESDAILCWNRFIDFYDNDNLETDCDDQTVKAGDADWNEQEQINNAVIAAVYLFDLTGEEQYSDFVRDNLDLCDAFINNGFGTQHTVFLEAILLYTTLNNAESSTVNRILSLVEAAVFGDIFLSIDNDLYRVDLPDWNYYWGSNMTTANFANLALTFRKYNINPTLNSDLMRKGAEVLHYFHGINPQGLVYLSNMYEYGAERSVNEIAHTWFIEGSQWDNALNSLGPAPGFLSGGPNQGYTGALTPPANQPITKSYLDYNDWFTDPAYEITEPAIYYQAAYIQLLSNFATTDSINSNTTNETKDKVTFDVFPNPNHGTITISGNIQNHEIQLVDIHNKIILTESCKTSKHMIDLGSVNAGVYLIRVINKIDASFNVQKIMKL